ncbi:MAG: TrkH family potassium uptake protein [Eubacterium sp.]|nr:TrkH family potassium uptake protein [Eubacterium sp.]
MNYSMIFYILFSVLEFEGMFLFLPAIVAGFYGEKQGFVYLILALVCTLLGFLGRRIKPKRSVFYSKEGFVSVSLSWIVLSLVGALPFYITGEIPSYLNALFETVSGFTTTGSSILEDVEALSRTTLFWRSFTHWIGGMGVLVFIMAVIPFAGSSSLHMMKAESPGPSVGKLVPKLRQTAKILYEIYMVITVSEIILLLLTGMSLFESLTLTFGTVGTGGFGVLNSSIASYSMASQAVITIFMIICSINFSLYYLLLIKKPKDVFFNEELRYYLLIVFASAGFIAWNVRDSFNSVFESFHHSLFQVASIISTTGYSTTNFNVWPGVCRMLIVCLMFIGASAGSTGGGFKVSRLIIIAKAVVNEVKMITHPRSVQRVRADGKKLTDEIVRRALVYLGAYVFVLIVSVLLVSINEKDFTTAFTAVMATFNNIGPGLNDVYANFSGCSVLTKIVLMADMLIGRLEIFPMFVLMSPSIWMAPMKKIKNRVRG